MHAGAISLGCGTALALAACGGGGGTESAPLTVSTVPGKDPDVDVLNRALALEQEAIALYAGATGVLRGPARTLGRTLLTQEMAHADALSQAIGDLGGTPVEPRLDYTSSIGPLRDGPTALRAALRIEQAQIRLYVESVPKLARPPLRATAAAILTSQAEHVALLRARLGLPLDADPLVRGRA